jgi:hypothetical protein
MRDEWVPENVEEFALYLKRLRAQREGLKAASKLPDRKRSTLSSDERDAILRKTDGRCHVCGGLIEGPWQTDHVLAYSSGGDHSVDNYLPAHRTCNNYRWNWPTNFRKSCVWGCGSERRSRRRRRSAVPQASRSSTTRRSVWGAGSRRSVQPTAARRTR